MGDKMMKIEDIAKLANVSKSAVSLALNGKKGISEKTRDKILRIADENGYMHKSSTSEKMKFSKLTVRFLVVTDTSFMQEQYEKKPFFSELIQSVQEQCAQFGCELTLSTMDLKSLLENKFEYTAADQDGVILLGTNLTKEQILLIKNQFRKLVVLDSLVPELEVDFVVMNNRMGIFQAVQHLVDLGHKNVGYIKSEERIPNLDERQESFKQAVERYGLDNSFVKYQLTSNHIGINRSFQKWIEKIQQEGNAPTALLCENDYLAISTIKSLIDMGIRVPEQVSVIGFDNINESVVITPELTTIHVDKQQMAAMAVRRLNSLIREEEMSIKVMVDTKLIFRKSTIGME
ncbi:LacI family DNA-binding transcriptional regulator [Metasolibacillus sp. FSL H7-0170]|uniref:LacI family DNA-binding transcriptional regulator n=1 Tax=Metasolibacillus sp. FSL H7-0170 TaxID=2921431 RepID=UPI00315935D6